MDVLFSLILKVKILILCVSFFSQVSQMFIVCNDFVGDKHGFHNLKCDLVLKCLLMCKGGENIDKDIDKFKILCFMELNWVQLLNDFGKVFLVVPFNDVFTCWQSASGCIGGLQFLITFALRKRNFKQD